jgi:hypothetical protein
MNDREIMLNALKGFVLRATEKGATAEEIAVLPAVARVLLDYLSSGESNENYFSSSADSE